MYFYWLYLFIIHIKQLTSSRNSGSDGILVAYIFSVFLINHGSFNVKLTSKRLLYLCNFPEILPFNKSRKCQCLCCKNIFKIIGPIVHDSLSAWLKNYSMVLCFYFIMEKHVQTIFNYREISIMLSLALHNKYFFDI